MVNCERTNQMVHPRISKSFYATFTTSTVIGIVGSFFDSAVTAVGRQIPIIDSNSTSR